MTDSLETPGERPVSETPGEGVHQIRGTMLSRLLGGSAVSLLGFCVTVLQAILQVPLLLEVWPAETFAAWVTATAMHSFLVSCDIGFHSFIGVELILSGLGGHARVRRLFAAALRVWVVLSLIQLAVLAVVRWGPSTLAAFHPETARVFESAGKPLAVLIAQWVLVGSLHSLVCRVLLAGGQTVLFQWLGIIHRTLLFAATVAAAWLGLGATGVALAYSAAGSLSAVLTIWFVLSTYPMIVPRLSDGSWRAAWALFGRSTGLTFANMLEQSSVGGLTTAVAGAFHELQVAAFSTMRSLANFVSQAAGVVMNPAVPELGRSANPESIHKAALIIEGAFVVGCATLAAGVSLAAPWMADLYAAWTRHALPFEPLFFIGLVAAVLVRQVGMPLQYFLLATNRVRPQFIASAIRAAALYASLPVLIPWLGLVGVGTAMVVAEACCAGYLAVVTRRAFLECGGTLPPWGARLATAHVVVAVAALFGVMVVRHHAMVWLASALAAHVVILGLQIRQFPPDIVLRMLCMLPIARGTAARRMWRA